jgi:hypothetical protein
MKKSQLLGAVCASFLIFNPFIAHSATLTANSLDNIFSYGFNQEQNYNYADATEVRSIGPVTMTWSASPNQQSAVFDYYGSVNLGSSGNGLWSSGRDGYAASTGSYNSMYFCI